MIDAERVVAMKAGPHAREGWTPILRRKMDEELRTGAVWWGYGGTMLDPKKQIQQLCKDGQVHVAMFETRSDPGNEGCEATQYSVDNNEWQEIPSGVRVTGSTRALIIATMTVVRESIDLAQYEIAVGPSAGRRADDYFFDWPKRRRTDKGCLRRSERSAPAREEAVTVHGVLVPPFAVYLR